MIFNGHSDILADVSHRRSRGELDILRRYYYENFRKGGLKSSVFVVWTEPYHRHRTRLRTREILEYMDQEFSQAQDIIQHCKSFGDLLDENSQKINIILAFEGLEHLGEDLSLLAHYKEELGIFYASLTWNEQNQFASGAGHEGGLTDLGRECIRELERNRIILDLSHLNDQSLNEALEIVERPVIASHSNLRSLCPGPRNISDDQALAIVETGGLIGLNSYRDFIHPTRAGQDIDGMIDHIDYLRELVGLEHIVFGFDFCDRLPQAYRGASKESTSVRGLAGEEDLARLIGRMYERGYSQADVEQVAYKNYYDFLEKHFS